MSLFDIFKNKKSKKEVCSCSIEAEDGQFSNLSREDLVKVRQTNLKHLISKGDIVETLNYIINLDGKETLSGIDEYESELRRQVEELERCRRGVDGDMSWLDAKVAFREVANQFNWGSYTSPFKLDSYILLGWDDIKNCPEFHFSGSGHCDIISIGLVKSGKYANQLYIKCFNDGYPSGVSGVRIDLLPENNQSYSGVKEYCYGRDFVIDRDVITEQTYNERVKELYFLYNENS